MRMRPINGPVLAALLSCLLAGSSGGKAQDGQQPNGDVKAEFEKRLTEVRARASGFHRSLARWLGRKGMNEWALKQWDRAIELDPDAAKHKPERESWTNRPKGQMREIWLELEAELQNETSKKVAGEYAALAKWASGKELAAEAGKAWAWAIEYDTENAEARAALKHVKFEGRWHDPGQQAVQKIFSDHSKVDTGKPIEDRTAAERALDKDLNGRRSEHIVIEADFLNQDQLAKCVEAGERTYRVYEALFGPTPGAKDFVAKHLAVESQKDYEALIDALHNHSGFNKEAQKQQTAAWLDTDLQIMKVSADFPALAVEGHVHFTVEMLLGLHASSLRPWIYEGIAFYFVERRSRSAGWRCFGGSGTTIGRDFSGSFDWRASTKALVRLGVDPTPEAILRGDANDLNTERSLKMWSYIDFILAAHRPQAPSLILAMKAEPKSDKEDEAVFKKALGVSVSDFDAAWRNWVLTTY